MGISGLTLQEHGFNATAAYLKDEGYQQIHSILSAGMNYETLLDVPALLLEFTSFNVSFSLGGASIQYLSLHVL